MIIWKALNSALMYFVQFWREHNGQDDGRRFSSCGQRIDKSVRASPKWIWKHWEMHVGNSYIGKWYLKAVLWACEGCLERSSIWRCTQRSLPIADGKSSVHRGVQYFQLGTLNSPEFL